MTDLPPEEAAEWIAAARARRPRHRLPGRAHEPRRAAAAVAEASRGFVYAVSRTGVTGERDALSDDARPLVARLKALTGEPVALGFGISTPEQVAAAAEVADARGGGKRAGALPGGAPAGRRGGQVRWLKSAM